MTLTDTRPQEIRDLSIEEVSGVGPRVGGPAHNREGFAVLKSADVPLLKGALDDVLARIQDTADAAAAEAAETAGREAATAAAAYAADERADAAASDAAEAAAAAVRKAVGDAIRTELAELQKQADAIRAEMAADRQEATMTEAAKSAGDVWLAKAREMAAEADIPEHEAMGRVLDLDAELEDLLDAEGALGSVMYDAVPARPVVKAADAAGASERWLAKARTLAFEKGWTEHEAMEHVLRTDDVLAAQLDAEEAHGLVSSSRPDELVAKGSAA